MFKEFAEEVGKAHNQLMEGAITYQEFFNYTMTKAVQVLSSERYEAFMERNPNGDPMGADIENRS